MFEFFVVTVLVGLETVQHEMSHWIYCKYYIFIVSFEMRLSFDIVKLSPNREITSVTYPSWTILIILQGR